MKTLIVGDMHLKQVPMCTYIDTLLDSDPQINRIVFTGDYVDDWNDTFQYNLKKLYYFIDWIINTRRRNIEVELLFGNHDFGYLRLNKSYGSQRSKSEIDAISSVLSKLDLKIYTIINDSYLVTHAGLCNIWVNKYMKLESYDLKSICNELDRLYETDYQCFDTAGYLRGGNGIPSPLWADRQELKKDNISTINQIVGHSPVISVQVNHFNYSDLVFCDTWSTRRDGSHVGDKSMLTIDENNNINVIEYFEEL